MQSSIEEKIERFKQPLQKEHKRITKEVLETKKEGK